LPITPAFIPVCLPNLAPIPYHSVKYIYGIRQWQDSDYRSDATKGLTVDIQKFLGLVQTSDPKDVQDDPGNGCVSGQLVTMISGPYMSNQLTYQLLVTSWIQSR
jgi:hypothetical protein